MKSIREMSPEELEEQILYLPKELLDSIKDRIDTLPLGLIEDLINHRHLARRAKIRYDIPFSRREMRRLAMEAVYHHLLLDEDILDSLKATMLNKGTIDPYLYDLAVGTVENEAVLSEILSDHLRKDWKWDRLAMLERAILLVSLYELKSSETPAPVVIDEAVRLAKSFCDENSPSLVNALLDRIAHEQ